MSVTSDLPLSFDPDNPLAKPDGNGRYSFRYSANDGEQVVSWLGPMADQQAFIDAVLFKTETVAAGATTITRTVPLQCPYDSRLYATEVSGEAFSAEDSEDLDLPPWKDLIIRVRFGVLPYSVTDGDRPFLEFRGRANPQRISIPNFAYELIDNGDPGAFVERVAQDVTIPVGQFNLDVIYHELIDLPAALAAVVPHLDHVNSDEVVIPEIGLTAPRGTLHFQGTDFGKTITVGSNQKSTLSLQLVYRPAEWNRAVASKDPYKGTFLRINPPPIGESDLNEIVGY